MADYIPAARPIKRGVETPLTLTQLQLFVGGLIHFVELLNGDYMVVNEGSLDHIGPFNDTASKIAGPRGPIFGDAVLCSPSEIA